MKLLHLNEDSFNKSIISTIKSISNKKDLYFYFKKDSIKIDGNKIYLPEISTIKNQIDLDVVLFVRFFVNHSNCYRNK